MNVSLKQQIENIIDKGEGRLRDVIIHVRYVSPEAHSAIDAGLAVLRNRAMIVDASEILPPPRRSLETAATRGNTKAAGKSASLVSQISRRAINHVTVDELRKRATDQIESAVRNIAPASVRHQPRVFWSSNSVSIQLTKDELAKLRDSGESLAGVYPNRVVKPPRYGRSTPANTAAADQHATSSWGIERTGALAAWGAFGAKGRGVRVAVLDTGADLEHPDLAGKLYQWAEFDSSGAQVAKSKRRDTDQHGTHVCGTVAGGNASGRFIGMAPEAELLVGLVLDGRRGGTDAQILAGMDWAIDNGADVINLSLGGLSFDPIVTTVYQSVIMKALRAGIPVVAAIGNDGHQTTGTPGNDLFAFSVGAVDSRDRCAGFSGGRTQMVTESPFIATDQLPLVYSKPDLSAPGVSVYSSVPGKKWEHFNGTSMATPHVSGAIAQLLSATNIRSLSGLERASVIQDLLIGASADCGESGQDHRFGFGRIDIFRASITQNGSGIDTGQPKNKC